MSGYDSAVVSASDVVHAVSALLQLYQSHAYNAHPPIGSAADLVGAASAQAVSHYSSLQVPIGSGKSLALGGSEWGDESARSAAAEARFNAAYDSLHR